VLRQYEKNNSLPDWSGLDLLEPDIANQYQDFARKMTDNLGVSRIHLTIFYGRAGMPNRFS
jgi:hypothetical protein